MSVEPMEIDDALYSRQRYVLGDTAMQRMAQSNIFISGVGGIGIEIAKNIVLAGVKLVTIHDDHAATEFDLGTQFFLRSDDVINSRNRAEASVGRLAELNPYVEVKTSTIQLTIDSALEFLDQYQCVVLSEKPLSLLLRVNEYCRSKNPPIKFIAVDVRGVFCWCFSDFGEDFEVVDSNGEEPREVFISDVKKGNPGIVTTLENKIHGFQTGDVVTFKEVKGMTALNGKEFQIEVISPYIFSICDTTGDEFLAYEGGGLALQVKIPKCLNFRSLQSELCHSPSLVVSDLTKFNSPAVLHLGMLALDRFHELRGVMPKVWDAVDANDLVSIAKKINQELKIVDDEGLLDEDSWRHLSFTAQGCLAPLCAFMGGVVAQEALKALTGKFSPLSQWLHLDAREVLPTEIPTDMRPFHPRHDRYDALRICVGEEMCRKLAEIKLFMVGCGAIGCELLKNFSLLGCCQSASGGKMTITDNDLIEKSNLNRQFLFRPEHICKPKSITAASAATDINPSLNIDAHQHKVCAQTESVMYTDQFFEGNDVIVNALDNLEARRYMDSRCVTNQRPLLESGTLGPKGHVQVIIPFLTESYASQNDPVDEDVPFCTLHSFPAVIDHCIEWARDKFETFFAQKPAVYNKFFAAHSASDAISNLTNGIPLENAESASKMAAFLPESTECCIATGRIKFEKFFNHRAKQLLHAFPLDTRMKDGSLFWQSPKRPPMPIEFQPTNALHLQFVRAFAHLFADMHRVKFSPEDFSDEKILRILPKVTVPKFEPKNKRIETDESAKKPEEEELSGDELKMAANRLRQAVKKYREFPPLVSATFEKDDDSNGHIDFIVATSNLRATMYGIETSDRLKIKRIAGRIVPAIATTTAAVAGLVSVELIKVLKKVPLEGFRNSFINLALPMFVLSEPGPVNKTVLSNGVEFSLWDRWEIQGTSKTTLKDFIDITKAQYNVDASMIVQGVKMIYVPIMGPSHMKRLPQPMTSLVKITPGKPYVDLVVTYSVPGKEDEMGPPVRYYL